MKFDKAFVLRGLVLSGFFCLFGSAHALVLSDTSISVSQGQTFIVTASESPVNVPTNDTPSVATASVSGSNQVSVYGNAPGNDTIFVCSASNSSDCEMLFITVPGTGNSSTATTQSNLSFSQTNVSMTPGQIQGIDINGEGGYDVSSNSISAVASASIGGSILDIDALETGATSITICQSGGQCGTVYVTVNTTSVPAATVVSSGSGPLISSLTFTSSGGTSGFAVPGSTLTISLNSNESIMDPLITINGSTVYLSGSGTGPYSTSYTVPYNTSSVPIQISLRDSSGNTSQASMTIGGLLNNGISYGSAGVQATAAAAAVAPASSPVSASASSDPSAGYSFAEELEQGSSGDDVTALQERLAADGFFTVTPNGYFGPATEAALEAYQTKHGLDAVGVAGPATRALLNQGV